MISAHAHPEAHKKHMPISDRIRRRFAATAGLGMSLISILLGLGGGCFGSYTIL